MALLLLLSHLGFAAIVSRLLVLSNISLRSQLIELKRKKPRIVPSQKSRLIWILFSRFWPDWREHLIIVEPETVLRWNRMQFRKFWALLSRRVGRPETDWELIKAIRRIAKENPHWGTGKVHGEILKLGFGICEETVRKYMPRRRPSPKHRQSWRTFLSNHRHETCAMDFLICRSANFRQLFYVLFVIHLETRRILHTNVTEHPTRDWVKSQLRQTFDSEAPPTRFLIYDRDILFSGPVTQFIRDSGIEPKLIGPRSPWQNGYAERWVRTCRQECLDRILLLNENHLRRKLGEFVLYYNQTRTHRALNKDAPEHRRTVSRPSPTSRIRSIPVLGGLHHYYLWD